MVSRKGSLKIWKFFALFLFLRIGQGLTTEYQPWLGNIYEFEFRSSLIYQGYGCLSSGHHLKKYSSDDVFLNVSVSNTFQDFALEIEAAEAWTRRERGGVDQLKITGRYVWQDDIAGDPLTFTTGLSFIQAFQHSLKDVSCFHHGLEEGELFLSLGKETPLENLWGSRWWGMLGIGIAERGSPWLRFYLSYEKRWWDQHEMKLFLHSLWGLGHKRLHLRHFHGYGPLQHQSVDIGLRYTYLLDFFGSASLEYSYRIHAQNFPLYTHRVLVQLLYTFGL